MSRKEEKKSLLSNAEAIDNRDHSHTDLESGKSREIGEIFPDGLTSAEAKIRLEKFGLNAVEEKVTPTWKLFLNKFWGPMPILIEIAVILSLINGILSPEKDYVSFGVLLALLIINGLIGFFEERNAGKAIAALKKSLAPQCSVKRDGKWDVIDAKLLVPGDLITIKLGDIVPADCRLSEHSGSIEADESALTGESLPVNLNPGQVAKSGAIIRKGEVEAHVTATGANTYIGEAMQLVAQAAVQIGNFQKVLFNIAKVIIVIALCCVVVIFCVKVFKQHETALAVLDLCLVLLVASIPIAMQVVCTGTMAVGSRRLAQHKVIVSRLGSIEELAGMTILCSDKTGTLTLNKLQMREPWVLPGITNQEITFCASLASKRVNADAIDTCIVNECPDKKKLDEYKELDFLPFDPISKRTECTVQDIKGITFKVTKGAPQVILAMASNREAIEKEVENQVKDYAERGLRTLGVARAFQKKSEEEEETWEFMGLLSFHDPPRQDTKHTIEKAIEMGCEVKMITGDHLLIAKETAKLLGMGLSFYGKEFLAAVDAGHQYIDGVDVLDIVEAADGFAQVSPKHKYFIVDCLQKRGHITGMTGDGVNDAPALKKADIGIAVQGATEAAKAAADIVLLEPGLSVIITAIIRSRKIFQRMKNYCIYRITCTVNLLLFFSIAIIAMNFSIPTICLVILVLLNDGTIMTIAHDKVIPSKKPEKWKLLIIAGVAIVIGAIATLAIIGMYFLYSSNGKNLFGYNFNQYCYYSTGPFYHEDQTSYYVSKVQCNPECPTLDANLTCGNSVGWSELMTVVYMVLSVGGQLTVFIARTKNSFWSRRPGWTLLTASVFAQIVATLLSVYWPLSFNITSYVGVVDKYTGKDMAVNAVMRGIGWEMAGIVWLYCFICFVVEDLVKVYFYYSLDNENTPDVDIQKMKRERKPFLPSETKAYEKKTKVKKNEKVALP